MTKAGFGAVTVTEADGTVKGIFTDGDLRRNLEQGEAILQKKMGELTFKQPITVQADALLFEASELFKKSKVDTIIVVNSGNIAVGMIDVQDIVKMS
jgi:signal-transduction protein with cAMP-binding, CBS, and nucleotidyltransferase domain